MKQITILPSGQTIDFQPGKNLLEILADHQIFLENPCHGRGICGKCKIQIKGMSSRVTVQEMDFLTQKEMADGVRLACFVKPESHITILLPEKESQSAVLSEGKLPSFSIQPSTKKVAFRLDKRDLAEHRDYENCLSGMPYWDKIHWPVLKDLQDYDSVYTGVIRNNTLIQAEQGDTTHKLFGLAVDVGTTTVVVALVDMNEGKEIDSSAMVNPQKVYGTDVLTRISYAQQEEGGLLNLQQTIVDGINLLMKDLCRKNNLEITDIYEVAMAGNTTMLHLLAGVDPSSLGRSPYTPVFTKSKELSATEVGIACAPCAGLYLLPGVSAFIGADIVAGAFVAELAKKQRTTLFLDIGTNGEMILCCQGRLISCSCAAGPALEGMNISCGMRAQTGAVEAVSISEGHIDLKVIGDIEPEGICGSGILSAVKELLRAGFVKPDGALYKKDHFDSDDWRLSYIWTEGKKRGINLSSDHASVSISQTDIRQVQLAKGALLSGVLALLSYAGISTEMVDSVIVAGQFGAHLSAENLTSCGILPELWKDRIEYIGNSSKSGALAALLSLKVRKEMEMLAEKIEYMELSTKEGYQDLFVQCLAFPEK